MNSPDYFSVYSSLTPTVLCVSIPKNALGFQKAKHKNFYVGITTKVRNINTNNPKVNLFEAIQILLPTQLIKDHIYDFTMYYSLADGCGIACNQLQAYFTVNQFSYNPSNYLDPNFTYTNSLNFQVENDTTQFMTDTMNWVPLKGCFIAQGGETYLSIGNFRDGVLSRFSNVQRNTNFINGTGISFDDISYYYIDDLSLYDRGYYSGKAQSKKDSNICFNSNLIIGNNIKDSAAYLWQPNTAISCINCPNPIANPTITTKYYVTKTLCSFVTKDSVTITVFTPTSKANAGANKQLCLTEQTQLGVSDSTKFTTYIWQPNTFLNCINCPMPFCNPNSDITYTLQKTECNISSSSTIQVNVEDCQTTYTIPNIFTPNNDGVNDVWGINFNVVNNISQFQMSIYNRWGVLIFEGEQPNIRWDGYTTGGLPCSDGVYFFECSFKVKDEEKKLKGNITLVK